LYSGYTLLTNHLRRIDSAGAVSDVSGRHFQASARGRTDPVLVDFGAPWAVRARGSIPSSRRSTPKRDDLTIVQPQHGREPGRRRDRRGPLHPTMIVLGRPRWSRDLSARAEVDSSTRLEPALDLNGRPAYTRRGPARRPVKAVGGNRSEQARFETMDDSEAGGQVDEAA